MLFLKHIKSLVRLGYASTFLSDEKVRLNLLLVGSPELGKTATMLGFDFDKLKKIFVFSDITRMKLEEFMLQLRTPHSLTYVVLGDFTSLGEHNAKTVKAVLGILNRGLEEGIKDTTTYSFGHAKTIRFKKRVIFGLVTSCTRKWIEDRRHSGYMLTIGLMSRLVPVSASYTEKQVKEIRNYIAESKDLFEEEEILQLKPSKIKCDAKYVKMLDSYIDKLADAVDTYGFRYTRQFRIMLKANALLRNSPEVTLEDVENVKVLLHWVNLDYNPIDENGHETLDSKLILSNEPEKTPKKSYKDRLKGLIPHRKPKEKVSRSLVTGEPL
jgi:hypothetical protein